MVAKQLFLKLALDNPLLSKAGRRGCAAASAPCSRTIPERFRPFVRVGTCSWKYDSWKGLVYRPCVKYGPDDYLPDYVKVLNTVEIDQWFWSLFPTGVVLPDEAVGKRYAESVPDDFLFTIKAPNTATVSRACGCPRPSVREWPQPCGSMQCGNAARQPRSTNVPIT